MSEDRVALITGASQGIGSGIAIRLARDGLKIGLNYHRNDEGVEETKEKIIEADGTCKIYKADVSSSNEVKNMVKDIISDFGHLDVLICNAGIYTRTDLENLDPFKWKKTIDINLTGAYNCTYSARKHLELAGEGGRIVYITSQLAYRGTVQGAHYAASKSALTGFMKSVSLSFAPYLATVNAVSPGFIDTPLIGGDTNEKRQQRIERVPLHRIGTPEDIAGAVSFLCSNRARYITGETVHVNGGLLMY